jgi:hypothetical protein
MIGKLTSTLRGWVGRYGSEAALVGRVAIAALLPPGCDRLLSHGLEAAFEYLQGKSDVISDHDLADRLDGMGIPRDQLNDAVAQIDRDGQLALDRAYQAHQVGISEPELISQLRELIASDPTLSALQTSMSEIADQLRRIEAQGELLIAGQHYQTAAIEEMMQMMRAIATQVGMPTAEVHCIPTPKALPKPTAELLLDAPAPTQHQPTDALSLLGSSVTPKRSPSDALSTLGSQVTSESPTSDALSLLGSSVNRKSTSTSTSTNALSILGSSITTSAETRDALSTLESAVRPQERSASSLLSSSLSQRSSRVKDKPHRDAQSLVERFISQQRARSETLHLDRTQAVALVQRFKDQMAARSDQLGQESPHIGNGRVSLTLVQVGPAPITIVKWLCEEWGYSLQDAIITTQSAPCVVRRADNFVILGQARNALEKLGAELRLVV